MVFNLLLMVLMTSQEVRYLALCPSQLELRKALELKVKRLQEPNKMSSCFLLKLLRVLS